MQVRLLPNRPRPTRRRPDGHRGAVAAIALGLVLAAGTVHAQEPAQEQPTQEPADWPCPQALVPSLSHAMIWDGPSPDPAFGQWRQDARVAAVVRSVAARSTPIETAVEDVTRFAAGLTGPRNETLTRLFAGIFEEIDTRRAETIEAIRRFTRSQTGRLDRLSEEVAALDQAEAEAPGDTARVKELTDEIAWERRILEERERSLRALCEQPVLLEQRLGVLAREIANLLE